LSEDRLARELLDANRRPGKRTNTNKNGHLQRLLQVAKSVEAAGMLVPHEADRENDAVNPVGTGSSNPAPMSLLWHRVSEIQKLTTP
jgi:hypothetical protein